MTCFSFSKKFRLLKCKDFNSVFSNHYKVNNDLFGILGSLNNLNYPRLGCSVSRKKIKQSNKRNTTKRIIRESFRQCKNKLIYMDFIVVINGKDLHKKTNKTIKKSLKHLWSRFY